MEELTEIFIKELTKELYDSVSFAGWSIVVSKGGEATGMFNSRESLDELSRELNYASFYDFIIKQFEKKSRELKELGKQLK